MSERITGTALAEMLARNSGMPTSDAYNLDVQVLVAEVLRLHALESEVQAVCDAIGTLRLSE